MNPLTSPHYPVCVCTLCGCEGDISSPTLTVCVCVQRSPVYSSVLRPCPHESLIVRLMNHRNESLMSKMSLSSLGQLVRLLALERRGGSDDSVGFISLCSGCSFRLRRTDFMSVLNGQQPPRPKRDGAC